MGFKTKGLDKAIRSCDRMERGFGKATERTVDRSMGAFGKESRIQVPKDTGALLASAREIVHEVSSRRTIKGLKYGYAGDGENQLDYAAAVHEILKASHAPPTKAKYVEDPLVQNIPRYKVYGTYECRRLVRNSFR